MELIVLLASASVFFILQAVYWTVASRRSARDSALAARLGTAETLDGAHNELLKKVEEEDGLIGALPGIGRLRLALEAAGDDVQVAAFVTRMLMFFLGVFALFLILTGSFFGAFLFGMVGSAVPILVLLRKKRQRINRVEEQLPEALEVMTISLRAGHSLQQTIRLSATELQAPIGEELRRVAEEGELGRPLDEALVAMSQRLREARTVRTFVVSVLVLRQTGGNLIEVLESIIDTMRAQSQYERKLRAMTAEGRSSSRMLAGLPPAFAGLAWVADPTYIGRLANDTVGQLMLFLAGILYVVGVIWVRRLVTPRT